MLKRGFGEEVDLADIRVGGEADDVVGAGGLETGDVLLDRIGVLRGTRESRVMEAPFVISRLTAEEA